MRTFEELIAEAEAETVSVDGWDFSWLEGRAAEERPSRGYQRLLAGRLAGRLGGRLGEATADLDIQTGGGEVLAGAVRLDGCPPVLAATESWPPNLARATRLLHPPGAVVVADPDEPPLPFADGAFDLVGSRHPVRAWWTEIARVLRPGGTHAVAGRAASTPRAGRVLLGGPTGGASPSRRSAVMAAAAGLWAE